MPEDIIVVPGLDRKRSKYVLKRLSDKREFVAGYNNEHMVVLTTERLSMAEQFASRIAARGFTLTHDKTGTGFRAADWEYYKIELVPEPETPLLPADLLERDPVVAVRRIVEMHARYCEKIEAWVRYATRELRAFKMPTIAITVRAQKWAGLYSPADNTCHYVLPYAMMMLGHPDGRETDYEHIVAHEVVHAYQTSFTGCGKGGHGGDFYAMMRHAAGRPTRFHTHSYSVKKCVEIAKALQTPVEQMIQAGLFAGLGVSVVTDKVKRKGLQ